MEKIHRKVEIHWKYNPSTFFKINREVLGEVYRKIGSAVKAVNIMVSDEGLMKMLMPNVLGVSPNSTDINWTKVVKNYWDSLSVDIDSSGKKLETGFSFDLNDYARREYIEHLVKNNPEIKSNKKLAEFVMGYKDDKANVTEEEKWKYGTPINVEDYLLWRYSLNYRDVANNVEDANKSSNIRFYLHTEAERKRLERQSLSSLKEAMLQYGKLIEKGSIDSLNDVLSLMSTMSIVDIVQSKDLEDKQLQIGNFVQSSPSSFLEIITDKNLKTKAQINRYLAFNVIKKLSNTTIYVDALDTSVVLGNNLEECIIFFHNEKNNVKLDEFKIRYKSLIS
jgi:hypothetical protein